MVYDALVYDRLPVAGCDRFERVHLFKKRYEKVIKIKVCFVLLKKQVRLDNDVSEVGFGIF